MFGFSKPGTDETSQLLRAAERQLRHSAQRMDDAVRTLLQQQALIDLMAAQMEQRDALVVSYAEEVTRLNAQDLEQMERLTAYARWCDKQGCAPTDADLAEMIRG